MPPRPRSMPPVGGRRPALAMVALLAAGPALAACGADRGGAGTPLPYVAEFALGADTPEARDHVLTPTPGPRVQVLPEPAPAPPMTPVPGPGEEVPVEPTTPAPGRQVPLETFQPSVAWVDGGEHLAVVTFGSGSCPSGPHGIEVVADQVVEIRLGPLFAGRDVCTADMSGHVTVVELPAGITPTEPLVARFADREVTIPAVSG